MDFWRHPPQMLVDQLPASLRGSALPIWLALLGLGVLVALLILSALFRALFFGKKPRREPKASLTERLADFPELRPGTGDRRLLVEGTPVRLRLVVLAPAGEQARVDPEAAEQILERVLLGLGDIVAQDKPRVRVWPKQVSYEGFARTFFRETIIAEREGEQSRWVRLAGRAKLGKYQIMLGLAVQAVKPNSLGVKVVEADQWVNLLRIRTRD